jgi:hypothetical protein
MRPNATQSPAVPARPPLPSGSAGIVRHWPSGGSASTSPPAVFLQKAVDRPGAATKPVSVMPSGAKIRSARNSGKDWPDARATSRPWIVEQVSYSQASPGWWTRGTRASRASQTSDSGKLCTSRPSPCTGSSARTAGRVKSDGKPQPAWPVRTSNTVIGRFAGTTSSSGPGGVRTTFGSASSGSQRPIGSSRASRPSSTSTSTAAAVIGLVMDANRNSVSSAIGRLPSTSTEPAVTTSRRPPRSTIATAPGSVPSST